MSLLVKKGIFQASTSGGVQSVTGVGFQPKAVVFFAAGRDLTADGFATHQTVAIGAVATTGKSEVYSGFSSGSTAASGVQYTPQTTRGLILGSGPNVATSAGVSITADGFDLSWNSTPAGATLIHYLAIGGTDVLNAEVKRDEITGTGSQSITGLSFAPDAMIFMTSGNYGPSQNGVSFGAAVSATKRWAIAVNSLGGDPVAANNWAKSNQRTDRIAIGISGAASKDVDVDFSGFTADGCTLNAITNMNGFPYVALFLRTAGRIDVGSFNKSTSAGGSNTVTPSFSAGPCDVAGVLQVTFGRAASTSLQPDSKISIGAFTGTAQGCTWAGSNDVTSPSLSGSRFVSNKAICIVNGSTVLAESNGSASGNNFTNSWTTNNATAAQVVWMAFGNLAATTQITGALQASRPTIGGQGKVGTVGTSALVGPAAVIGVQGMVPVSGISGSAAVSAQSPSVLSGLFVPSAESVPGEAVPGEAVPGPPEYTAQVAMVAAKPTVSAGSSSGANEAHVAAAKPTIAAVGAQRFIGTVAAVAQKPTVAVVAKNYLISGSAALSPGRPTVLVPAQEKFLGPVAVVGHAATVASAGLQGTARAAVVALKPTLAVSGSVTIMVLTATVALTAAEPALGFGPSPNNRKGAKSKNVPPRHLWTRARKHGATVF